MKSVNETLELDIVCFRHRMFICEVHCH